MNNEPDFPLPAEVFTEALRPGNLRRADWLDRMRLSRWIKSIHSALRDRALRGNGRNHECSFLYRGSDDVRRVRFDGRNAQFHALYEPRFRSGYEAETAFLLLRLARGNAVFYDIGANWGYFSLLLAASPRYLGSIRAFEPNPRTHADLRRTIAEAGVADRIVAVPAGMGRTHGELRVEETDAFHTGLARLSAAGAGATVPIYNIDDYDGPPPDIIKIDAEGMELAILEGATQTLAARRPHVVFESFRDFENPAATRGPLVFLAHHGYDLFNPALAFTAPGGPILAGYDAPVAELLAREARPPTALVPVNPVNRFVMPHQLNIWACHRSRLAEMTPPDFVRVAL